MARPDQRNETPLSQAAAAFATLVAGVLIALFLRDNAGMPAKGRQQDREKQHKVTPLVPGSPGRETKQIQPLKK